MNELVIMDYSKSDVHFYKVNPNTDIDEEYIRELGYNPDECSWMFDISIGVFKHKDTLK